MASIGNFIGIAKSNCNYRVGVYLGDDNLALVYEYGSTPHSSLEQLEKLVDLKENKINFPLDSPYVKKLSKFTEEGFSVQVSKINLFEAIKKEATFFEVMNHNFLEMNKLEIGDVVFFDRKLYNHSAILSNLDIFEVIHKNSKHQLNKLIEEQLKGGNGDRAGEIRQDILLDVIQTSKIFKINVYDRLHLPFSGKEIVERAMKSLGPEDYDIVESNCQHYAFLMRNNVSRSPGIEKAKETIELNGIERSIIIAMDMLEHHKKDMI